MTRKEPGRVYGSSFAVKQQAITSDVWCPFHRYHEKLSHKGESCRAPPWCPTPSSPTISYTSPRRWSSWGLGNAVSFLSGAGRAQSSAACRVKICDIRKRR